MEASYQEMSVPRIHLGLDSDWYKGMRDDNTPTPNPARQRPAMNNGMAVAIVWKTTPRVKTAHATATRLEISSDLGKEGAYGEGPFDVRCDHRWAQR